MARITASWALLAVVSPVLCAADEPAPPAQSLAAAEAAFEHCAKLLPEHADEYRQLSALLTQGVSDETLEKVRASEEYRNAHEAALDSIAQADEENAKKACQQQLAQKSPQA